MRKAFTMIELVFTILIIGILAGVGIAKLNATRIDAEITKNIYLVKTSLNEINSYVTSQGESFPDLTLMSNILKSLENSDQLSKNIGDQKVTLKIGQVNDCVNIYMIEKTTSSNTKIKTLSLDYGTDLSGEICNGVIKFFKEKSYDIPVRGQYIKR